MHITSTVCSRRRPVAASAGSAGGRRAALARPPTLSLRTRRRSVPSRRRRPRRGAGSVSDEVMRPGQDGRPSDECEMRHYNAPSAAAGPAAAAGRPPRLPSLRGSSRDSGRPRRGTELGVGRGGRAPSEDGSHHGQPASSPSSSSSSSSASSSSSSSCSPSAGKRALLISATYGRHT